MARSQKLEPRVVLIFRGRNGQRQIIELPRTEIERGRKIDALQRKHGTLLRLHTR